MTPVIYRWRCTQPGCDDNHEHRTVTGKAADTAATSHTKQTGHATLSGAVDAAAIDTSY